MHSFEMPFAAEFGHVARDAAFLTPSGQGRAFLHQLFQDCADKKEGILFTVDSCTQISWTASQEFSDSTKSDSLLENYINRVLKGMPIHTLTPVQESGLVLSSKHSINVRKFDVLGRWLVDAYCIPRVRAAARHFHRRGECFINSIEQLPSEKETKATLRSHQFEEGDVIGVFGDRCFGALNIYISRGNEFGGQLHLAAPSSSQGNSVPTTLPNVFFENGIPSCGTEFAMVTSATAI